MGRVDCRGDCRLRFRDKAILIERLKEGRMDRGFATQVGRTE